MTDQQSALESAGLYGQVESGHPSLPSSLEKVCGGTRRQRVLSGPPEQLNKWAVDFSYAH
jgi:hypothetical protein